MKTKDTARAWLASVVQKHLPSNARRYKFAVYCGQQNYGSFIGLPVDPQPVEGKVVEVSDEWLLVKTGRSDFFIADRELLSMVPQVGDTVLIEPWARRGFDGLRLDAMRDSGNGCKSFVIGETRSRFPGRSKLQCPHLIGMLDQLEALVMPEPDGIRTIAQVLIDAGAWNHPVEYCDPTEADIVSSPPRVTVTLDAPHIQGGPLKLSVVYNRGMDTYSVETVLDNGQSNRYEHVTFDMLPEIIGDIASHPGWRTAKVTVLAKKAHKKLPKAA
jgi:hypothetical protein